VAGGEILSWINAKYSDRLTPHAQSLLFLLLPGPHPPPHHMPVFLAPKWGVHTRVDQALIRGMDKWYLFMRNLSDVRKFYV